MSPQKDKYREKRKDRREMLKASERKDRFSRLAAYLLLEIMGNSKNSIFKALKGKPTIQNFIPKLPLFTEVQARHNSSLVLHTLLIGLIY